MRGIVVALFLFCAGCASVQNPITKDRLYAAENGAIVVFAGLNAYKQSCMLNIIPQSCREVIARMQVVTRQIPPYLTQLRVFVKNNDQVNALVAYQQVQVLIATAKSIAASNSVPMGGQ